jgi:hypothetical protein
MDIDGDGERREFGLRGQRRGTESDKRTAGNSLPDIKGPDGGQPFTYDLLLL